jgi:hypothetical protein
MLVSPTNRRVLLSNCIAAINIFFKPSGLIKGMIPSSTKTRAMADNKSFHIMGHIFKKFGLYVMLLMDVVKKPGRAPG